MQLRTALEEAIAKENEEIVKKLVDAGCDLKNLILPDPTKQLAFIKDNNLKNKLLHINF